MSYILSDISKAMHLHSFIFVQNSKEGCYDDKSYGCSFCSHRRRQWGLAMAGYLAYRGFSVNLYNRTKAKIQSLMFDPRIELSGAVEGTGLLNLVTDNMEEAIRKPILLWLQLLLRVIMNWPV